jgi:hypothetical protein
MGCLREGQRSSSRGGFEETAASSDIHVRELVATARGPLIDLAWKAPQFEEAERHLIGYELFRDDASTRPPSRRTWKTMPLDVAEARGLEDLPNSQYGVQPIWRLYAPQPPYAIEFGPPSLPNHIGADPQVVVPPEERIHALAWLQRDGLITSEELELAVDQLLGRNALPAPAPVAGPVQAAAIARAPAAAVTRSRTTRTLVAYIAVAVVLILAAVVGAPFIGGLLFAHPTAVRILPATSATPTSAQPSPSPVPPAKRLNLQTILLKPSDLRPGYVSGPFDVSPLCAACLPASYSLSVTLKNPQLNRTILARTSVATFANDTPAILRSLMRSLSTGAWATGSGLGDESHTLSVNRSGTTYFYVVWRSGVITEEILLTSLQGSRTLQDAIDLAKIQQARTAAAHA